MKLCITELQSLEVITGHSGRERAESLPYWFSVNGWNCPGWNLCYYTTTRTYLPFQWVLCINPGIVKKQGIHHFPQKQVRFHILRPSEQHKYIINSKDLYTQLLSNIKDISGASVSCKYLQTGLKVKRRSCNYIFCSSSMYCVLWSDLLVVNI